MGDVRYAPLLHGGRSLLVAVVTVQLGVLAHVTAGGLLPGSTTLAVLLGAVLLGSAAVLGRPVSTPVVVALLVGGQSAVHAVLSLTAGHAGDEAHGAHGAAAGSAARASVPGEVVVPALPTGDARRGATFQELTEARPAGGGSGGSGLAVPEPVAHLVSDLVHNLPMALTHLVAAALVGLWLARGEQALHRFVLLLGAAVPPVVRRLLVRLGVLVPRPVPTQAPAPCDRPDRAGVLVRRHLDATRARVRRGPPLLRTV